MTKGVEPAPNNQPTPNNLAGTCEVCEDEIPHFTVAFVHQGTGEIVIQDMCQYCAHITAYLDEETTWFLYQEP